MFCGFPNPFPVNELCPNAEQEHSTLKMSVGGAEATEEACEMKGTKDRMKPWRLKGKHNVWRKPRGAEDC